MSIAVLLSEKLKKIKNYHFPALFTSDIDWTYSARVKTWTLLVSMLLTLYGC